MMIPFNRTRTYTLLLALLLMLWGGADGAWADPKAARSKIERSIQIEMHFLERLFARVAFYPDYRDAKKQLVAPPDDAQMAEAFLKETLDGWPEMAKGFSAAHLSLDEFNKYTPSKSYERFKKRAFPAYRACITTRLYGLYGRFGPPFADVFHDLFILKNASYLKASKAQAEFIEEHSDADSAAENHVEIFGRDFRRCIEQTHALFKKTLMELPSEMTPQY